MTGKPSEEDRIRTTVRFDNSVSKGRTVIDVETEDRLGLLYTISQVFMELGISILVAKVTTDRGSAAGRVANH